MVHITSSKDSFELHDVGDLPSPSRPRAKKWLGEKFEAEANYRGYESLNYEPVFSERTLAEEADAESRRTLGADAAGAKYFGYSGATIGRWSLTVGTGLTVGLTAWLMSTSIKFVVEAKIHHVEGLISEGRGGGAFFFLVGVNLVLACSAAAPVIFAAPMAAGSGIPEVMGYLNGVHIRQLLHFRTLCAKIWGTVSAVASGLAVGPEGPLVHIGAIIGAGFTRVHQLPQRISTAVSGYGSVPCASSIERRCTTPLSRLPAVEYYLGLFSHDADRRDLISEGAAAGFAAAFGAPIGGVLFALEEATTYFSQHLLWRCLACTSIACFTLSLLRSTESDAGDAVKFQPGMLTLSTADPEEFSSQWELLLCAVEGAIGGLLGAVFNRMFISIQLWRPQTAPLDEPRSKQCRQHILRLLEVVCLSILTTALMFGISWMGGASGFACHRDSVLAVPADHLGTKTGTVIDGGFEKLQFYCEQHASIDVSSDQEAVGNLTYYYNDLATVFFTTRENSVQQIMENPGEFSYTSLAMIVVVVFGLTVVSFGAAIPAGMFMPTIVMGVAFGGFYGKAVKDLTCILACLFNPACDCWSAGEHETAPIQMAGPYALLGAVALLGGIQRSSLSLVVIIVEGTGKIDYLLPIIITTITAKWVGDSLNGSLYHTALELKGVPFIESLGLRDRRIAGTRTAGDVMRRPVVTLGLYESVTSVLQKLDSCDHQGFPVVDDGSRPSMVPVGQHATSAPSFVEVRPDQAGRAHFRGTILRPQLEVILNRRHFFVPADSAADDANTGAAARDSLSTVDDELLSAAAPADPDLTAREMMLSVESDTESDQRGTNKMNIERFRRLASTEQLQRWHVNVSEAMNVSPITVQRDCPLPRVYRVFRTMELRHLVVTGPTNEVTGIITREDLLHALAMVG